ncbi:hypothetical protein [Desulfuromonas sp. CSMB_57]|jgi:peptidoglycan hydrolase CwlO-like protein|uniref:hypothetical protein n=1 Tax=Desulfuromonas sp. CSMB_57 TaxID=2807629 RepID=UPI001CD3B075|nr:hypothetical protein [Desulfuromonas sp. CSMB_57]
MTQGKKSDTNRPTPEEALKKDVERLDADLEIMERHAEELAEVEDEIQSAMKKQDREIKDNRLHSIPRPLKHTR